jgi:hypothetical protein
MKEKKAFISLYYLVSSGEETVSGRRRECAHRLAGRKLANWPGKNWPTGKGGACRALTRRSRPIDRSRELISSFSWVAGCRIGWRAAEIVVMRGGHEGANFVITNLAERGVVLADRQ